jgi:hypothetical protein
MSQLTLILPKSTIEMEIPWNNHGYTPIPHKIMDLSANLLDKQNLSEAEKLSIGNTYITSTKNIIHNIYDGEHHLFSDGTYGSLTASGFSTDTYKMTIPKMPECNACKSKTCDDCKVPLPQAIIKAARMLAEKSK